MPKCNSTSAAACRVHVFIMVSHPKTKPMGTKRGGDTWFLFHCFSAYCCSDTHPSPWQAPSFAPFPCLSYVVSECQPSFAPPRELQASVTLSYTRHVKARRQANGHRSAQNQVKCQRLYPTLLVIVTFGEQKLVIWKGRKKELHNQCANLQPSSHIVSLQSERHRDGGRGARRWKLLHTYCTYTTVFYIQRSIYDIWLFY